MSLTYSFHGYSITEVNKTNNCGNPAGKWDTYNVACNQISHSALKGDEVFQSGTYFLPAHVYFHEGEAKLAPRQQ